MATLVVVTVTAAPRPAGADQITTLQGEATALAQKLVQEQLEVDADQQQYSVASAQVAADQQAIANLDQQIATTEQAIVARSAEIRTQAVRSYVDEGAQSDVATLFTDSADRVQEASEYQSIAVGNITTQIDRLRTAQHNLQTEHSALAAREAADRAGRDQQATALSQADQTAQQLAAAHAQVTGQLASAVAAAQAAEAAQAAAAVAAAQQAAAARSVSTTSSSGAPASTVGTITPTGGATNDPALPPFLQCVVQAESGGNYGAVSPNGEYMGAFQFSQSTWNMAAQAAGLPGLVGVPPNEASKADQDTVAITLYSLDGEQPWLGDRCSS